MPHRQSHCALGGIAADASDGKPALTFAPPGPTCCQQGEQPMPRSATPGQSRSTIDAGEVERFSALAAEWWNPNGKFRPLHKFNPVRLAYIRDQVAARFDRDPRAARPFEGLRFLDIGCGGGLLCEPLARLGAEVVGADASETNIEVAKLHAAEAGVSIDYRATTAEDLADAGETFDIVLAMEVVEHVADVELFISKSAHMVRPRSEEHTSETP